MTTINALKNLYVELGGNINDVENITIIPEMIDALSAIAGSTIELPGVTTEDNGKVLKVVDGEWEKANNDFLTIIGTVRSGSFMTGSVYIDFEYTLKELYDAVLAYGGRAIMIIKNVEGATPHFIVPCYRINGDNILFCYIIYDSTSKKKIYITLSDNASKYVQTSFQDF